MLRAPILTEAFFQVDLIDGYGFLDARGALARRFATEFQDIAEVAEGNQIASLQFEHPIDPEHPILNLRVGLGRIWAHIREGATGTAIRQECSRVVETACSLTGATQFSRQGLRTYHLFGTDSPKEAVQAVRRAAVPSEGAWGDAGEIQSATLGLQVISDRLTVNLRISPAQRVRTRNVTEDQELSMPAELAADSPRVGVLLDVDVFDASRSDTRDPKPHLNRALHYIEERMLPLAGSILGRGGNDGV